MSKQAFRVEGDFQMGRVRKHFRIEVIGEDEAGAREAALAEMGSRHGAKRRDVSLENVVPLKTEEASAITRKRLQG